MLNNWVDLLRVKEPFGPDISNWLGGIDICDLDIPGSKLIQPKSRSKSTRWVRETRLMVSLPPIMIITA